MLSSVLTEELAEKARRERQEDPGDEREYRRRLHVLSQDAPPQVEAEEAGLYGCGEPAAHRPEDGSPHPDGRGYEDGEPDQLVQDAGDAGERDAGHELARRREKERREPLPQRLFLLGEVPVHFWPDTRALPDPAPHRRSSRTHARASFFCFGHPGCIDPD